LNKTLLYNFIAIEGNIGAGKTSLAKQIAATFNAQLILEQFEENSFLPKFYENPSKYALPLELSFLVERHQQLKTETSNGKIKSLIVSDYFFLKSMIFASENLNEDERLIYTKLFNILHDTLPKPELFVYLHQNTDNLIKNIKKRGRPYEQNIQAAYLQQIEKSYFNFLKQQSNLKILILDISTANFVDNVENYDLLIQTINQPYSLGITNKTINLKR